MHQRFVMTDEFDQLHPIPTRTKFINTVLPKVQAKMKTIQYGDRWCTMYACILYVCYLQRINLKDEKYIIQKDQEFVLQKIYAMVDLLVMIAFHYNRYDIFSKLLQYMQYSVQGIEDDTQQLKQIPYIRTQEYVKLTGAHIHSLLDTYRLSNEK
uniref:Pre-mRNA-splicing helicase BRR2 n=1 Tax=Lygus hesperus TaxID=30085 RepID=A0A0A9VY01_LYGHE